MNLALTKQKIIIDAIEKAFSLNSESETDDTSVQTSSNKQIELMMKKQQQDIQQLQHQMTELINATKSEMTKRSRPRSPSPNITSDDDEPIQKPKASKSTSKQQTSKIPSKEKTTNDKVKLQKLITELTSKYAGRNTLVRKALEDECGKYKIMPDVNRAAMIKKLAIALMH